MIPLWMTRALGWTLRSGCSSEPQLSFSQNISPVSISVYLFSKSVPGHSELAREPVPSLEVPETINVERNDEILTLTDLESDGVISLRPARVSDFALVAQFAHVDIVNEGDVVLGVPVQAVAMHRERDRVKKPVKIL